MAPLIIFVVALAEERRALQRCLLAQHAGSLGGLPLIRGRLAQREVLLLQTGIGRCRAREGVLAASRAFSLQAVWSLGFAGGLTDWLCPGDLIYPAAVLDDTTPDAAPFSGDPRHALVTAALQREPLVIETGPLLTADSAIQTPEAKRDAHRRTRAVAVDMEAAGVASAAQDLRIPWAALKGIVDTADTPLPAFLTRCATPQGEIAWGGLLGAWLEGPAAWRALARIGWASRRAGRNLCRGLQTAFGAWVALTPP